eukprot:6360537-Karenia_brevis.AAC.1
MAAVDLHATTSACDHNSKWGRACLPDVIIFNAAILKCEMGGHRSQECVFYVISFNAAIDAWHEGRQWLHISMLGAGPNLAISACDQSSKCDHACLHDVIIFSAAILKCGMRGHRDQAC